MTWDEYITWYNADKAKNPAKPPLRTQLADDGSFEHIYGEEFDNDWQLPSHNGEMFMGELLGVGVVFARRGDDEMRFGGALSPSDLWARDPPRTQTAADIQLLSWWSLWSRNHKRETKSKACNVNSQSHRNSLFEEV